MRLKIKEGIYGNNFAVVLPCGEEIQCHNYATAKLLLRNIKKLSKEN